VGAGQRAGRPAGDDVAAGPVQRFLRQQLVPGLAAVSSISHTWLDRGGPEGDLMELNGWPSPQMPRRHGASARSARARRT
jgi:hypothetical protein